MDIATLFDALVGLSLFLLVFGFMVGKSKIQLNEWVQILCTALLIGFTILTVAIFLFPDLVSRDIAMFHFGLTLNVWFAYLGWLLGWFYRRAFPRK